MEYHQYSLEEIVNNHRLFITISEEAGASGAKFVFGVDETRLGFRLTINYRLRGIYLGSDVEMFRASRVRGADSLITPSHELAGKIEGEAWGEVIVYVAPQDYSMYLQDAEVLFKAYCSKDWCFRGIPSNWFNDLLLIRFVEEKLFPHPSLIYWFNPESISSTHMILPQKSGQ